MSRQVFLILLLLQSPAFGQVTQPVDRTRQLVETARQLVAVDADGCLLFRPTDEIVVCGPSEIDRQQRLPFPALTTRPGDHVREPLPRGNPEIVQQGRCYVTMAERNCFKGLSVVSIGLGASAPGAGGAAGRAWQAISPGVPDADYVKQAMVRPLAPAADE